MTLPSPKPGALKYLIHTSVGSGPQSLGEDKEHLLGADGMPKTK